MRKIIFILLCTLSFISSCAQDVSKERKRLQLDSLFSSLHNEQKFFGNVLIAEKGEVLYQKSFGKANEETGANLNSESIFELASVSKQFTAMGIMLLKKQGKLNLDDSLRHFFPELPYSNITLRHLLNHTSGLPDYMELVLEHCTLPAIPTNADMIALLAKYKLPARFDPGDKWEYSNTGYALLGSVIEKVSGKSFPEFLDKNIFRPLDMKRTLVYRRRFEKKKIGNYALGYGIHPQTKKYVLPDDDTSMTKFITCFDGIMGDGTVNSTTNDLLKWDRALYTEKLLTKQEMQEAFERGLLKDGSKTDYGFGWGIHQVPEIGKLVSHTGGWPGYNTLIERHLDTDKTIIILRNHQTNTPLLQKVRDILYGKTTEAKKEVSVKTDSLKQYVGDYELAPEFILNIFIEEGNLWAQATGQEKARLYEEKPDMYFVKEVEAKLKFVRDSKGNIESLILYQNGQEVPGKKIK